jgi:hypothetical protein
MSEDVRYKMQHLGDIFADALSAVVDSAQKRAKSLVLTYDIHDLKQKKQHCLGQIGRRVAQVKKEGLAELQTDGNLVELIAQAEKIDNYIASCEEKKKTALCGSVGKAV